MLCHFFPRHITLAGRSFIAKECPSRRQVRIAVNFFFYEIYNFVCNVRYDEVARIFKDSATANEGVGLDEFPTGASLMKRIKTATNVCSMNVKTEVFVCKVVESLQKCVY